MNKLIIYGAGKLGRKNLKFLVENGMKNIIYAFCDRNFETIKDIDGIPVISYEEAKKKDKALVLSVEREKESIIHCFQKDKLVFYHDLREWISNQFIDEERLYYLFLYNYKHSKGNEGNLLGQIEIHLFRKLEPYLSSVKRIQSGYCPCCENTTLFVAYDNWLRDDYKCIYCDSIPRQRALIKVLNNIRPNWQDGVIHESSPNGPTMKLMQKQCKNYTYSYFHDSLSLGSKLSERVTNQNIENLFFDDEIFDIFITQDVFEHIQYPFKAFKEIARVLKKGGIHIFTVPLYPFIKSRPRICINSGEIENILPPIYHGNPISSEGSLVTYDWGGDITELIEKYTGLKTEIYEFRHTDENINNGLEADFLQVLVSYKIE